jgi:3-oxoadipate enol-lactonase
MSVARPSSPRRRPVTGVSPARRLAVATRRAAWQAGGVASLGYDLAGPAGAPLLVLGSSLGATRDMWPPAFADLTRDFRVLRYDHRGHGASAVPPGPYSLDDLGGDVLALLDAVAPGEPAHYAGVSLGGMVGMWLASHAPERIGRLAVITAAAYMPPPEMWSQRATSVLTDGMDSIADAVVARWFTPEFAAASPEVVSAVRGTLRSIDPVGYAGCCAAIGAMDQRPDLGRITAPTLVIYGDRDPAAPPAMAHEIADGVPGARLEAAAGAHLVAVENPSAVLALLTAHFLT